MVRLVYGLSGSWLALLMAGLAVSQPAVPAVDPDHILQAMRQYGRDYIARLPDFICLQTTEEFDYGKKATHWRKGDTLTSKLLFSGGREKRTVEAVNGHPVQAGSRRALHRPLTTEGEFGILLANVLGFASEPQIQWRGTALEDGMDLAVFDYAIDREHSTLKVGSGYSGTAIVPYHGSIYADPQSGAVLRITNEVSEIPRELKIDEIVTEISYGKVAIASINYLLPVAASVTMRTPSRSLRHEIKFVNYQKFETESHITFQDEKTPPEL
jgi:hypothetical protein